MSCKELNYSKNLISGKKNKYPHTLFTSVAVDLTINVNIIFTCVVMKVKASVTATANFFV